MVSLLTGLAVSIGLFIIIALLILLEERRGSRLFAVNVRSRLDQVLVRVSLTVGAWWHHVVRRVITLSWYYSLHAFLKFCLRFIASVYEVVEHVFIKNRNKARQIRRERRYSHLISLKEHKIETSLTEAEKKRVKAKALNS